MTTDNDTTSPAAYGEYQAMVLSCIDPRRQERVHEYLQQQGLTGQVSQFVIAGAAIDHRDCGGAPIAYGAARLAIPEAETETPGAAMAEFRAEVGRRHPGLDVVTGLMALDGAITLFI